MLDCFYIPMHRPSDVEIREIIEDEGSFELNKMEVHEVQEASPLASHASL